MIGLSHGVPIKLIADLLDYEITDLPWFNYDLGGRFGGKLSKNADTFAKTHGKITPGTSKAPTFTKILKKLPNSDFSDITNFYVAILAFFTEKVLKNVDFDENFTKKTINSLFLDKKCPKRHENDLKSLINMDFDFEDFLYEASKNEKLFFDYDSALSVYRLQGDDAIFGILCQIFWVNKYCDKFSVRLIDYLPINLPIEVSDWLSGCVFPVVVSPCGDELKWKKNENGWFLYQKIDEKWLVLDVGGTNFTILGNKPLANRLNFLAGGGKTVPYVICNNWGEIINAVNHFGQKLLIRDLKNTIFDHYWFIFGPDSKLNVKYIKNGIWNTSQYWGIPKQYDEVSNHRNGLGITVDLNKNFISYCEEKDIVFNASEAYDWFEIGQICEKLWR